MAPALCAATDDIARSPAEHCRWHRSTGPISRANAQQLLLDVTGRAREYNANPAKLHWITTLAVFGSYLSEANSLGDVDMAMGDVDMAIVIDDHPGTEGRTEALLDYAHVSEKSFNTFSDRLCYSREELLTTMKKRSNYIHIHTEDISRFTETSQVIFAR